MLYDSPTYFRHVDSLEELKKQFHALALKLHPDAGGSNEEMARLNLEYQDIFKRVKGLHKAANGSIYEKETDEGAEDFPAIIVDLLKMGLTVEVCGSWIWISGPTKTVKERLKNMGARWSPSKKLWYIAPAGSGKRHWGKAWTMDRIRDTYGAQVYETHSEDVRRAG